MSMLAAINSSISGLAAIQADMQVISGNVSNAQNPNYTHKSILLEADPTSGGVDIAGYTRSANASLTNLLQQANGDNGLFGTQQDYLQQIQNLLGSTRSSPILANDMAAFQASWQALSASPSDITLQQDVIFKGQALARDVNQLSGSLEDMLQNVKSDMSTAVDTLNTTLKDIENLNQQIVAAKSNGDEATENNLIDKRDADVQTLSSLVNIKVLQRSQDTIGIYTPAGVSLLDLTANQFAWDGTKITLITGASAGTDVTNSLLGGKIEAIAGMLDQGSSATTLNDPGKASIYKIQQQLNTLVTLFTDPAGTFTTAYDPTVGPGRKFFFTGTTADDFAVSSGLLDGSVALNQNSAGAVSDDMNLSTRTINSPGLNVTNASYTSYVNSITSKQNQNTKEVGSRADTASAQVNDYQQRLQASVGVNIDDEIATLTQLQNNYAATAHVLSTIQQMFATLNQIT